MRVVVVSWGMVVVMAMMAVMIAPWKRLISRSVGDTGEVSWLVYSLGLRVWWR